MNPEHDQCRPLLTSKGRMIKQAPSVLIFTQYVSGLNGAVFRHQQIAHLIRDSGFQVIVNPNIIGRFRQQAIQSLWAVFRMAFGGSIRLKSLIIDAVMLQDVFMGLLMGRYYHAAKKSIQRYRPELILVEDVALGVQGALFAAKESNIPVVALPHNIDGLAGERRGFARKGKFLAYEMEVLSLADIAYSISKNDTWLHQQFGIKSFVLPYYPAPEREAYLRSLKSRRTAKPGEKRFLIPGSAHNKPTKEGMVELLEALAKTEWPGDVFFDVVGTETDSCRTPASPRQFRFHGSVDMAQFASLVADCTACIAYQRKGTGSLTRVLEMVMAGVPILGNGMALRGWHELNGTHLFRTWEDLTQLVTTPLEQPLTPERPAHEESHFRNVLKCLIQREQVGPNI